MLDLPTHLETSFTPVPTGDGSFTFFSPEFGETFHSQFGARQEAEGKFIAPTQLEHLAKQSSLVLLDVCYGLGYNSAAALEAIWRVNPDCRVQLIALELNPQVPQMAIAHGILPQWSLPVQTMLKALVAEQEIITPHLQAKLYLKDARQSLKLLVTQEIQADAICLDPFSPPRCPQLWTVEFLTLLGRCLTPTGRMATYSCAGAVRRGMQLAGLNVASTPPVGRRAPGTMASFAPLPPLPQIEQEHLQTRAAVPYRDLTLSDPAAVILQRRQQEQQTSTLEPTSAWKRRWFGEPTLQ